MEKQFPKSAEIYNLKGIAFIFSGNHAQAIDCFNESIMMGPELPIAYFYKGLTLFLIKNYDESIIQLDLAVEHGFDYYIDLSYIIKIFYNQGIITNDFLTELKSADFELNEELKNELSIRISDFFEDSSNKAVSIWTNTVSKIIDIDQKYIKQLSPESINPVHQDIPESETSVLKGIKSRLIREQLLSIFLMALIILGIAMVYFSPISDWHYASTDDIKRSAEESLNTVPGLNNQATLFIKYGLYDQALDILDRAINLDPNYAESYYNKGNALVGLKKNQEAADAYDMAIILNPGYAEAIIKPSP